MRLLDRDGSLGYMNILCLHKRSCGISSSHDIALSIFENVSESIRLSRCSSIADTGLDLHRSEIKDRKAA